MKGRERVKVKMKERVKGRRDDVRRVTVRVFSVCVLECTESESVHVCVCTCTTHARTTRAHD